MALDALWSEAFPTRPRPQVYSSQEIAPDGYLPLTDASDFLVDSLHGLGASQLYALTANNAEALRQAQDEWINLERLANQIKTQDRFSSAYKDPQALPSHEIFEERKEATLYDYKHEPNRPMLQTKFTLPTLTTDQEKFDLREPPNPFAHKIPTDKQYRSIMTNARTDGHEKNPDEQTPYEQNFAFQARPPGTWIAKMAPTEAVQPPRTRAREAQLNGTAADRQTRFNGEKVPLTRGVASADEIPSQGGTPIGSPAGRKRKIETVDIALPRKKHPNQHTKRREREEAERLAALNLQQGLPPASQPDSVASPISVPKKKHPNQYTKRREREEAERLAREKEEDSTEERDRMVLDYFQPRANRDSDQYASQNTSLPVTPIQDYIPQKRKQPNQYTKRREAEQAAEAAGWLDHSNDRDRQGRSDSNQGRIVDNADVASRHATPASPRPQAQAHPGRNIDFSNMTTAELRTFTFKDWELTALLQERYLWLNDDPALAKQWKIKIENSAYAMRTYAMLKKWKEWASEGRDKRPRDKDKNKSKTVSSKNEQNGKADGEEADVESMADDPLNTSTDANNDSAGRPNSKIVTLKRPIRTRAARLPFEAGDSPKVMPSSPLVNGVNARDLGNLDKLNDQAKIRSFTSTLQTIGEVDNATKVGRWQADTATDATMEDDQSKIPPASGTQAPTPAKLVAHGTEDDIYPSTQSTLHQEDVPNAQQDTTIPVNDSMEVDSKDSPAKSRVRIEHDQRVKFTNGRFNAAGAFHGTMHVKKAGWGWVPMMTGYAPRPPTESDESSEASETSEPADTIRVKESSAINPTKQHQTTEDLDPTVNMSRTRSQRSNRSTTFTASPDKRAQQAAAATTGRARVTRGTSGINNSLPKTRRDQTPTAPISNGTESVSPVVAGGAVGGPTRRAGLRPNPVKRTLTNESLRAGSGGVGEGVPVRRSLRGSGVV